LAVAIAIAVFVSAFGIGRHELADTDGTGTNATPTFHPIGNADVTGLTARIKPAVVNITTTLSGDGGEAAGTGMVISSDGLVLTNNHVINGASDIQVEIGGDGSVHSARTLGYDVANDVALVQIKGVTNLKTMPFGDSSRVAVDDTIVAVGNALGRGGAPTVSQGSIAALDQTVTAGDDSGSTETLHGLIQIDAPIEPGDSGGPLVNVDGRVVGMNTAAASTNGFHATGSTVAFAIPINTAREIAAQIAAGKSSPTVHIGARGILGITVRDPASSGGGSRGNSGPAGALVVQVQSDGPADGAGVRSGDVVTAVAGQAVSSTAQLNTAMAPYHPGDDVTISWVDPAGQKHTATLTLVEGPPA
jgi:S1-C subfamily serine protease